MDLSYKYSKTRTDVITLQSPIIVNSCNFNIQASIFILSNFSVFYRIAGHPLAQNERCLHMFLQEPNIDRNYVPGKIRNTWRISMLQYVLVCHPGPAQIRRETRFTFNGHRICIIVKWGTQLWITWNDIDEKISIDFNVYEEKMHSQSFFKTNSMDCALAALLEMRLFKQ